MVYSRLMKGPEKRFDRDEVLDRAMALFWDRGYAATGMTRLLQQMGIGRQSLYDTFGDKKSLYLAALQRYHDFLGEQWSAALDAPGPPLENLKRLLRRTVEIAQTTGFCGCFIGNAMAEFGDGDAEVRRRLARSIGRLEGMLVRMLQSAREAGELSPQARPRDLARLLLVTIQGAALLSRIEPHRQHAREALTIAFRMIESA
jgi:TetR/AcrR family transcriptional repressor of nem operon